MGKRQPGLRHRRLPETGPHRHSAASRLRSWNLQVRLLIKESNNKTPVSPDTALVGRHLLTARTRGDQSRAGRRQGAGPGAAAWAEGISWPIWGRAVLFMGLSTPSSRASQVQVTCKGEGVPLPASGCRTARGVKGPQGGGLGN